MSQLIPGGQCGTVESGQIGPMFYPLTCPECEDEELVFGKQDNLAYGTVHHSDILDEVDIPLICPACALKLYLKLRTHVVGGVIAYPVKRK